LQPDIIPDISDIEEKYVTTSVPDSRINLTAEEWFWANWRNQEPLKRGDPRPFEQDAATRIRKKMTARTGRMPSWQNAGLEAGMAYDEAAFWFAAIRGRDERAVITTAEDAFGDNDSRIAPELMLCLAILVGPVRLVELILQQQERLNTVVSRHWHRNWSGLTDGLIQGMRRYVRPYMTAQELNETRPLVAAAMAKTTWPSDYYLIPNASFFLASILGLGDLLEPVIAAIPDKTYVGEDWYPHYHSPHQVVLGLGSSETVIAEMKRLKLRLRVPEHVAGWLAHTELSELDFVVQSVRAVGTKDEAEQLVTGLNRVVSPSAAPYILDLLRDSKAPQVARIWLEEHPEHAIYGLVTSAAGHGRLADDAAGYLRRQKKQGRIETIAAALDGQPPNVVQRVRELVIDYSEREYTPFDETSTPQWLMDALKTVTPSHKRTIDQTMLPVVAIEDCKLNDAHVGLLLDSLASDSLDTPGPLLTALKANADSSSLDAFAWSLFEQWLMDGAPPKEKWKMTAIGFLGSDAAALKLAPMVRKWPGEAQHARAVTGLECLRAIGTDTALMQINGIANKVAFKAIKQRAAECMDDIAKTRGMTRDQLEDRIIPDCDLDAHGSRTFDFGPRQFRLALNSDMKAMVKDGAGKIVQDLPKPNSKDDADKAAAAVAEWKLLKKQVAEVAKVQAGRLEQAMVTGRRWQAAEFDQLLVSHPLMINLVRLLVWGVYDDSGQLSSSFRVTEDRTLADSGDEVYNLSPNACVGIAHPLQLSDQERSSWGEILADYEIVPPFPQLGRPIHTLAGDEPEAVELKRFGQTQLPCATVVFTLDKLGWSRAQSADGGGFSEHTKPFYGANVTAVAQYDPGCAVGWIVEADPQKITDVFFVPGIVLPGEWWPSHKDRLKWGDVAPVVVSEVLADLTSIVAKE